MAVVDEKPFNPVLAGYLEELIQAKKCQAIFRTAAIDALAVTDEDRAKKVFALITKPKSDPYEEDPDVRMVAFHWLLSFAAKDPAAKKGTIRGTDHSELSIGQEESQEAVELTRGAVRTRGAIRVRGAEQNEPFDEEVILSGEELDARIAQDPSPSINWLSQLR